jgi:hypothetical protein
MKQKRTPIRIKTKVIYQWHFYFLRLIRFLLVLKEPCVTTYRNAVGNESCNHIALKGQHFCEKWRYVPLPLQGEVAWNGHPSRCGGLLRLVTLGRRKKRILDQGTLKKIKSPLIYYENSRN